MQLRVGATTVVVTGVVVLLIGLFLVDKVASGILHAKRDAAVNQARIGLEPAREVLADVDAQVVAQVLDAPLPAHRAAHLGRARRRRVQPGHRVARG